MLYTATATAISNWQLSLDSTRKSHRSYCQAVVVSRWTYSEHGGLTPKPAVASISQTTRRWCVIPAGLDATCATTPFSVPRPLRPRDAQISFSPRWACRVIRLRNVGSLLWGSRRTLGCCRFFLALKWHCYSGRLMWLCQPLNMTARRIRFLRVWPRARSQSPETSNQCENG